MAHPYAKHAQDKVGHAKAKSYQSGGKVREDQSLTGREAQRRENYAAGTDRMAQGVFGIRGVKPGSVLDRMRVDSSYLNTIGHDRAVPRRKED